MNTKVFLNFALVIAMLVWGCSKKPNASFTFDKAVYNSGDSLIITNTSTLSNTYRWTLPYGGNVYTKDLRVKLDSTLDAGRYTYKLESFSKNRKLVDAIEQSVYVESTSASKRFSIMFWATKPNNNNTNAITVTFNYQIGYLQNLVTQNTAPTFSNAVNSDYATFVNLEKGQYSYSALQQPVPEKVNQQGQIISQAIPANYWNGVINIDSDKIVFRLPPK